MSSDPGATRPESLKFTIRTHDFEKAAWFYREVLALEVVESWDEDSDRGLVVRLARGGLIEISCVRAGNANYLPEFDRMMSTEKVDIQLLTDDVDAWAAKLKRIGWPCRGPVDRPWGARYLYLHDPDGVKIILYQSVD